MVWQYATLKLLEKKEIRFLKSHTRAYIETLFKKSYNYLIFKKKKIYIFSALYLRWLHWHAVSPTLIQNTKISMLSPWFDLYCYFWTKTTRVLWRVWHIKSRYGDRVNSLRMRLKHPTEVRKQGLLFLFLCLPVPFTWLLLCLHTMQVYRYK